jgi:hypothetical protein
VQDEEEKVQNDNPKYPHETMGTSRRNIIRCLVKDSIYEGLQASKKIFYRASSLEKFVRTEGICTNLASKASNLLDILRGIDNYHAILNESASLNQACKTKDGNPI